ncbi:hypothetical protein MMC30_007821 [Trapelia coarctata]|nr:hypothetical protein [Trapelia coarctata]
MSPSADNGSNGSNGIKGSNVAIIDIRRGEIAFSILDEMKRMLRPSAGEEKTMPTMLLYNEAGLKLFEEITYLDEYYLTNAEIEVLHRYADRVAERIEAGSQLIELGSGNLRKVAILLHAIDKAGKGVDYYALDLSLSELQRTLSAVPPGTFQHVRCQGLLGTYDDGLEWLKLDKNVRRSKCVMSLGSSIGNFNRNDAAAFLKGFSTVLGPRDSMLIGIDGCQDKDKVYHAYNDRKGITHRFLRNGLDHASEILGKEAFTQGDWEVVGEYDAAAGRHQAFYASRRDLQIDDLKFGTGERVRIEEAYKYSPLQRERLWDEAGLTERAAFGDRTGQYRQYHSLSHSPFLK